MKDGVVLFLICVVAIGGIAAGFLYYNDHGLRGMVSQAPISEAAPEASAPVTPKPAAKPVKRSAPEEAAVAQPAPVAAPEPKATPVPAPAPVVAVPARPFPSVAEISVGLPEDTITDAYGDPALSALTSDRGHVVETFFYARNDSKNVTVISLEDGRVSSAYSRPRAASAVPIPLPLRRRGG